MHMNTLIGLAAAGLLLGGPALAAEALKGEVLGGGAPIADATVTLWAAGEGAPKELGRARTDAEGRFDLGVHHTHGGEAPLYLVAQGGRAYGEQGWWGQPRHRPDDGAGYQATGQGRHQRDDHHRFGLDAQPVPRGNGDQGPAPATEDRRGQCAELRGSGDRRLGHDHPGPAQQRPNADHGQLRHAGRCAGRVRDPGQGGCLRRRSSPPRPGRTARPRPTR